MMNEYLMKLAEDFKISFTNNFITDDRWQYLTKG